MQSLELHKNVRRAYINFFSFAFLSLIIYVVFAIKILFCCAGKLLGITGTLDSVSGVFAPLYGGEIFTRTGYYSMKSVVVAAHYLILIVVVKYIQYKNHQTSARMDKKNN